MPAAAIQSQLEYYFSDSNFRRDKFLRESADQNGYVKIETLLRFNKLKALTTDPCAIVASVSGESKVIECNEEGTAIRRKHPLPELDNTQERTLVLGGFGRTMPSIDQVKALFPTCTIDSVRFSRHNKKFQGFAYVEFHNVDTITSLTKENESGRYMFKPIGPENENENINENENQDDNQPSKEKSLIGLCQSEYASLSKTERLRLHRGCAARPSQYIIIEKFQRGGESFKDKKMYLTQLVSEPKEMPFMDWIDNQHMLLSFGSTTEAQVWMDALTSHLSPDHVLKQVQHLPENMLKGKEFKKDETVTTLLFTNVQDDTITREIILAQLGDLWSKCQITRWIDFKMGQPKGELHMYSQELAQAILTRVSNQPIQFGQEVLAFKIKTDDDYEYTRGMILKLESIPDGISREDLKICLNEIVQGQVKYVDYDANISKIAIARQDTPEASATLMESLAKGVPIGTDKILTNAVLLEGEEEKAYWSKIRQQRTAKYGKKRPFDGKSRSSQKHQRR